MEGLHVKHVVATWKYRGTIPAFAVVQRGNQEKTLCRDGRSTGKKFGRARQTGQRHIKDAICMPVN
jgi:hypothetical protein